MKTDDSQLKLETKGVWIPISIWDNKDLTLQEKAILVKVESFKECFASNDYLAEFINVSVSRVKQVLKSLEDKGYIYRVVQRKEKVIVKRIISLNKAKFYGVVVETGNCPDSDIGQEAVPSKDRKLPQPRTGSCPDNSKSNNSASNKDSLSSKPDRVAEIIDYLNQQAGTGFKHAKSHQRLINARLKEGHTVEDIKTVVDRKVTEWANTKMAKYLRPSTLFSDTNFNNYIGQITVGSDHEGNQQYNNQLTAEQERRARLSKYPAGRIQLQIEDRLAAEQRRDSILVVDNEQDIRPSLDFQPGRRD